MQNPACLDVINNVPWDDIKCSTSSCRHVPDAVRSLLSPNKQIRDKAYFQMDNHLVVQGELYEGAFYIVPFLMELLALESHSSNSELLDLVFEIANGTCGFEDHVAFSMTGEKFTYFIPNKDARKVPLQVACRFACGIDLPKILSGVLHPSESVREQYSDILQLFPELGGPIRGELYQLAKSCDDKKIQLSVYRLANSF